MTPRDRHIDQRCLLAFPRHHRAGCTTDTPGRLPDRQLLAFMDAVNLLVELRLVAELAAAEVDPLAADIACPTLIWLVTHPYRLDTVETVGRVLVTACDGSATGEP